MKKNFIKIVIVLMLLTNSIFCFFKPINPVDVSLGDNFVASDFISMHNPANVENVHNANIYAIYTNLYNCEDVHYSGFYFVYPSLLHFFGVNTNLLMFIDNYYETLTSVSYAQRIGNYVVGAKIKCYYSKVSSEFDFVAKELYTTDVDVGVCYETKKFVLGLLLENILMNEYKFVDQNITQRFKFVPYLGLRYSIFEEAKIFLQKNMTEVDRLKFSTGIQVDFRNQLFLRVGVSETNLFSIGFGIMIGKLRLDFSTTFNEFLGYNLIVGVGYKL